MLTKNNDPNDRETPSEIPTLPHRRLFSAGKKEKDKEREKEKEKQKKEKKKKNYCQTVVKLPKKKEKQETLLEEKEKQVENKIETNDETKIETKNEAKTEGVIDNNKKEVFKNIFNCLVEIKLSLQNSYHLFDNLVSMINKEMINRGFKNISNNNLVDNTGINLMNIKEKKINNNFINKKTNRNELISLDDTNSSSEEINCGKNKKKKNKKNINKDGYLSTFKRRKNKK